MAPPTDTDTQITVDESSARRLGTKAGSAHRVECQPQGKNGKRPSRPTAPRTPLSVDVENSRQSAGALRPPRPVKDGSKSSAARQESARPDWPTKSPPSLAHAGSTCCGVSAGRAKARRHTGRGPTSCGTTLARRPTNHSNIQQTLGNSCRQRRAVPIHRHKLLSISGRMHNRLACCSSTASTGFSWMPPPTNPCSWSSTTYTGPTSDLSCSSNPSRDASPNFQSSCSSPAASPSLRWWHRSVATLRHDKSSYVASFSQRRGRYSPCEDSDPRCLSA